MPNTILLPQIGPRCIDTGQSFTRDVLDRTSGAEQLSQAFNHLVSLKLVRHVRFTPNSYRRRCNAANDAMFQSGISRLV